MSLLSLALSLSIFGSANAQPVQTNPAAHTDTVVNPGQIVSFVNPVVSTVGIYITYQGTGGVVAFEAAGPDNQFSELVRISLDHPSGETQASVNLTAPIRAPRRSQIPDRVRPEMHHYRVRIISPGDTSNVKFKIMPQ